MTNQLSAQERFLSAMQEDTYTFIANDTYGKPFLRIQMKPISYHRWNEIGSSVKNPDARQFPKLNEQNKPVPNYESPYYLAALAAAENERECRRALACLRSLAIPAGEPDEDGNIVWEEVTIPGDTVEAQVAFLRDSRFIYTNALLVMAKQLNNGKLQRIEDVVDSFRRV